jgi:hypothetical protein
VHRIADLGIAPRQADGGIDAVGHAQERQVAAGIGQGLPALSSRSSGLNFFTSARSFVPLDSMAVIWGWASTLAVASACVLRPGGSPPRGPAAARA